MTTEVPCPTCRKITRYDTSNPSRPFCSERCRLIDLGEWASEGHRIAGKPAAEELLSDDLPPDNDRDY